MAVLLFAAAAHAAEPAEVAALRYRQNLSSLALQAEIDARLTSTADPLLREWWRLAAADVANELDQSSKALSMAAAVATQARTFADPDLQFEALALSSVILSNRGDAGQLEPLWAQMQALLADAPTPLWPARLHHDRGVLARKQGDFERALRHFEQALQLARTAQSAEFIARELNSIGMLHGRTGRFADALHAHDQAIEISRTTSNRAETARGLRLLGVLYRNLDDEELGSRYLVEALDFIDPRNHREAISVQAELAQSLINLGELQRAEPHALEAARLAELSGHAPNRVTAFTRLAELRLAQQRFDDAAELADRALQNYDQVALRDQILLQLTKARVAASRGELAAALPAAAQCVQRARELGDRILERSALDFLADLQLRTGDAVSAYASRKSWQALDKAMAMDMAARRVAVLESNVAREREANARTLLQRDNRIQSLTLARQRLLGWAMAIGLLGLLAIVSLLMWRHREARRRHAETLASRDQLARLHAELEASSLELQRIANADALTGLLNRRALVQRLQQAQQQAAEQAQPLALAIIDVDHFKRINDRYGHLAGDQVLCEVATRLRQTCNEPAVVGRWGGEEFLLLLPGVGLDTAWHASELMRQALDAQPVRSSEGEIRVTASFGVAALRPGETANALLARADQALYAAKSGGRNRVQRGE